MDAGCCAAEGGPPEDSRRGGASISATSSARGAVSASACSGSAAALPWSPAASTTTFPSVPRLWGCLLRSRSCAVIGGLVILAGVTAPAIATIASMSLRKRGSRCNLTVEDPIEFTFVDKSVHQPARRSAWTGRDWHKASRTPCARIRRDLIGELRESETFEPPSTPPRPGTLCSHITPPVAATQSTRISTFPAEQAPGYPARDGEQSQGRRGPETRQGLKKGRVRPTRS